MTEKHKEILDNLTKQIGDKEYIERKEVDEIFQKFGDCTKCYGKGYSKLLAGLEDKWRIASYECPEMMKLTVVDDSLNPIVTCTCQRGQELEKLL